MLSKIIFFSVAKPASKEPYLSTLNQAELEALGLKAVSAGANPQKLQQAFATAQIKGDWTKLEKEIAAVLGLEAINHPEIGLAIQGNNNVIISITLQTKKGLEKLAIGRTEFTCP